MKPEGGGGGGAHPKGSGLPLRVEQSYYKHGLFLSSYPTCATSVAIVVLLFCCYPLIYVPLPGTIPTKIVVPYRSDPANPLAAAAMGKDAAATTTTGAAWNGTTDRAAVFFG